METLHNIPPSINSKQFGEIFFSGFIVNLPMRLTQLLIHKKSLLGRDLVQTAFSKKVFALELHH